MDIPENLLENIGGESIKPIEEFKLDSIDDIKGTFDDIIDKYLPHNNE